MGNLSVFVASVAFCLVVFYVPEVSARCPSGWRTWRNLRRDCYFFSRYWYTWNEANEMCKSHQAELVSIRNPKEFNRISRAVKWRSRGRRRNGFFVGFNQVDKKTKSAKWTDGTVWTNYHKGLWAKGEPNNYGGKEFCGEMENREGKFNDIPCSGYKRRYVCRRKRWIVEKCDRPKGWLPFGNKCVKLMEGQVDWRAARRSCQEKSGDLLVVDSILKLNVIKESVICRTPQDRMWLGLSDTETPGKLQWVDGSPEKIGNWFRGEPRMKAKGQTCTEVLARAGFRWRNNDCGDERKYICEKDQGQCPEGWKLWRSNCYRTYESRQDQRTWVDAANFCQSMGAHLIDVKDRGEQRWRIIPEARRLYKAGIKHMWIGVSDKDENGVFRWTDRSDVRFKRWKNRNQPRYQPNQWSCGVVNNKNKRAKWITRYCFTKKAFICKKPIYEDYYPPTPIPQRACSQPGFVNFKDKCYFFSDYSLDWKAAQQECSAKWGANLATIDSAEVQSFIAINIAGGAHIGLNNIGRDSTLELRWVGNNQPVGTFKNWHLWHPILGVPGINCVNARGRGGRVGSWRTFNCTWSRNFICETGATSQILPPSVPPTNPWSDLCGPGWIYDKSTDFCYYIVTDYDSFFGAEESCKKKDGELLSIGSKHEQMFVNRIIKSQDADGKVQFWIGANNLKPDAGWMWTDDTAFRFFNWHPGMPDSRGGANCVKIETTLDGQWTTDQCDSRYAYICKKDTDSIGSTIPSITPAPPADCNNTRLVSGDHYIQDKAMTASSQLSPSSGPAMARIVQVAGKNGWQAQYSQQNEWIQVDFMIPAIVKGIVTKGLAGSASWVSQYKVISLYDQQANWKWYSEMDDGTAAVIDGNKDSDTEKVFMFKKPFQARIVRIVPVNWYSNIGLRLDVIGCIQRDCRQEGVISGDARIGDDKLSSSSQLSEFNKPSYSRINNKANDTNRGGWAPSYTDSNPWLQADLGRALRVRSVLTRGRDGANEWVTNYKLGFSDDGTNFVMYEQPYGTIKVFSANNDSSTAVQNYLTSPIVARYIRIYPGSYYGQKSLRWEVYACITECVPISLLSGDNAMDDDRFSASSSLNGFSAPLRSRLFSQVDGNLKGAWTATYMDNRQYIQVDLETNIYIVGVATRGRDDRDQWVTQYVIGYSHDGKDWFAYYENGERKLFEGNWDRNTTRKNYFSNPFSARYVRLYPQSYYGRISLRWELYGCPGPLSGIHAGCYADTQTDPDMADSPITSPVGGMTARICINHCFHQGYHYAGIKSGDTCHCSNDYGKHGRSTSCSIICAGDRDDKCGGDNANSIYNTGIAPTHQKCPPGWKSFGGSCFLISASRQTWDEAVKVCKAESAHLVSVDDQNEMDFVTYIVEDRENMWLGLNDKRNPRVFEWEDGTPVLYTNWDIGQPSNWASRDSACVAANAVNGRWAGESCSNMNKFLCEKPKESTETVMTTTTFPGCPRGWTLWNGNCYQVSYSRATWPQAATNCRTQNAELVRIMSREEMIYIRSRMTFLSGDYWMDLSDSKEPGKYSWSDGSRIIPYTNWGKGQPDSSIGGCVSLTSLPTLGRWYDRPCTSLLYSICKRPQQGMSTTPTPNPGEGGDQPCAPGWLTYKNNCFLVFNKENNTELLTWPQALADCRSRGADLASFHSQEELDTIWKSHIVGALSGFWIGLNRRDQTAGHAWSDMTAVDFTYWAPGEPNSLNDVENCVELYRNDGKWNDIRCDVNRNWICKAPMGSLISDLSTTAPPMPGGPGSCVNLGGDWRLWEGTCYLFADGDKVGSRDWRNAERYCKGARGGHLVSIHSQRQLNFIKGFLSMNKMSADSYWIGLNELDLREGYKWSDKTGVDFINWGPNEPNSDYGNEPCIALKAARGEWHNMHCADKKGWICSAPQSNTQAPPTDPPSVIGNCPAGFFMIRNKCLKFVDPEEINRQTFDGARNACIALGRNSNGMFQSDIAAIENIQEHAFVTAHLMDRKAPMWIGLYQPLDGETKRFVWASNAPVSFTAWRSGQPTRSALRDRNCVAIDVQRGMDTTGKWFDAECFKTYGYICQTQPQSQLVTAAPTENPCPRDFTPWRKSCYLLLKSSKRWQDAQQYCSRNVNPNAQLTTISDIYEQSFLYSMLTNDDVGSDMWIGLSDYFSPGVFKWSSSWPITFTAWDKMTPTRAEGGCVALNYKTGLWKQIACTTRLPSICEIQSEQPTPTPSPVANGVCPPDDNGDKWMRFGRSCFLFVSNKHISYKDADYECVRRDSQLTSVHSQEEHEFIANSAKGRGLWIGFHKTARQSFVWRDDSVVDFVKWNSGEPSDKTGSANENCVELWGNGNWNDLNCYNHRGFVCRAPFRAEPTMGTVPYKQEKQSTTDIPGIDTNGPTQPPVTFPPITNPPRTNPPPITFPPPVTRRPWPPVTQPNTDSPWGSTTTRRNSGPNNVKNVGVQTSGGEIAGIIILVLLLIVVAAGIVFLFRREKTKQIQSGSSAGFDNAVYTSSNQELQLQNDTNKDDSNKEPDSNA